MAQVGAFFLGTRVIRIALGESQRNLGLNPSGRPFSTEPSGRSSSGSPRGATIGNGLGGGWGASWRQDVAHNPLDLRISPGRRNSRSRGLIREIPAEGGSV